MIVIDKKKNHIAKNLKILIKDFLKTIFSKKYSVVKKIIVITLEKIKFYRFFFKCLMIKLQYPIYWRLPLKHIFGLKLLINFTKICEKKKIISFLTGGTLLGAVRQQSFAGRPSDIDIGILENKKIILDNFILNFKKSTRPFKVKKFKYKNKYVKLQFYYEFMIFDINIFSLKNKKSWFNIYEDKKSVKKKELIFFRINDLKKLKKIKVYNESFFIPYNSTRYLYKKFGNRWKIPDKKQYFWKKVNS